jgi:murein DD-endopeptidase MepM/ murein hydrolase activator NlpD
MRWILLCGIVLGCAPPPPDPTYPTAAAYSRPPEVAAASYDPTQLGTVVARQTDFAFEGGRIEIEIRRTGDRLIEVARNYYAVPVVMAWQISEPENIMALTAWSGVLTLPAGPAPNQPGPPLVLAQHQLLDTTKAFSRHIDTHTRWGDPAARPTPYAYRLPFKNGTFNVLQGFHGTFSHRGSNEYAVDFDCPVATTVVAARPGIVVALNADAQGSGTTPDYLDYRRTNFVLVLHDDGTLGEYMHLAASGVRVSVGQQVARGDELALSGNTGYSSTPHLHFGVITAAEDGVNAQSFPFELQVKFRRSEQPVQGRSYTAWE